MSCLNGETIVCDQHTGGEIQLRVFGDEFYARYEADDGYSVVYDTTVGGYCYALLASGQFVSSGVPVGKPKPPGLRKHLREWAVVQTAKFNQRHAQLRPPEPDADTSATRTLGPDGGLLDGRKLHQGTVRGLTVLVEFDDVRTNITQANVEEMLNGDDYTGNNNFCSVRRYFDIVSNGRLNYSNTVVGPIRLSKRRSHYINNLLVKEALDRAVDDFGIDLADFDSRNEGIVDAINFLYAGQSQYSGDLWPHNSVRVLHYGNVRTHYYLLTGLGSHRVDLRIGTICHENGHLLCRFPDMYDYGSRDNDTTDSQGIGRYCLMGSGNHLNGRRTPSPVCGYLRELAGWVDHVQLIDSPGSYTAEHGAYDTILKYETSEPNEYFILENRSRVGLDSHLPASGLAIYHCDTMGSNEWQDGTPSRHYQCALLQADGALDLENDVNAGDADDLFSDVAGEALSDTTNPSTRLWDRTDSGLLISDISPSGDTMGFRVGPSVSANITTGASSPGLLIPDNDDHGVSDTIVINALGTATSIAVRVEIIHSWIGDLHVALESPDGTTAVLHDRTGSNGDDIFATYSTAGTAALQALIGKPIAGPWKLRVVDDTANDVGRLEHWSIDIEYQPGGGMAEGAATPDLAIPDSNSQGVSSDISINQAGLVEELTVDVDIEHTYIGDLEVDLVSPNGRMVRLHNNEGGGRNNLQRSYDSTTQPLQGMIGESLAGVWRLQVRDLASIDTGRLKRWSLRAKYT